MKKRTKNILIGLVIVPIAALILVWFLFFRLPSTYSAEVVTGQIVDAKTGKPIDKAIVVAIWELERGFSIEGGILAGHLHVQEVLTDKDGFYQVDAWGPKKPPKGSYTNSRSPKLAIFKKGYYPDAKKNFWWGPSDDRQYQYRKVHKSDWHMQTLKLEPFDGDWKRYSRTLTNFNVSFDSVFDVIFGAHQCDWKKIPRMVIALDKHRQFLKERKLPKGGLPLLNQMVKRKECKVISMEQFIEENN